MSTLRKSKNEDGAFVVRLFNPTENAAECTLVSAPFGVREKIEFSLFQYGKKFSNPSLRKVLKSTIDGKMLEAVFTVTDSPKGKTDSIRVCFTVENGSSASIINVKAFLLNE